MQLDKTREFIVLMLYNIIVHEIYVHVRLIIVVL